MAFFMHRLYLIILLTIFSQTLTAQWSYDFSNSDLSAWSGDRSDFVVNGDERLQLNAEEAGFSMIYTTLAMLDSMSWSMNIELAFSPSTSNYTRVWLAMDSPEPQPSRGFFLNMGSSGNLDAIQLFHAKDGAEILIAEGSMGEIGGPFRLDLLITLSAEDLWTLSTALPDQPATESFRVYYETDLTPLTHFGIACNYSSTRRDKFFYDDLIAGPLLPDTIGPTVIASSLISADKVLVELSEAITEAISSASFDLGPVGIGEINLVTPTSICIQLTSDFPSGNELLLGIAGLQDKEGNVMRDTSILLRLIEHPEPNELLINELMYDPIPGRESDYLELINNSSKYLSLDSIFLDRANANVTEVQVNAGTILDPGRIVAVTPDSAEISSIYEPIPSALILEQAMPNYVNGAGNVRILRQKNGAFMTIDSFDYSDELHGGLLTSSQKEGVSLERLSLVSDTNDKNNWYSAASNTNFGTPGYENSQRSTQQASGNIGLAYKTFSPNADGYRDFMKLDYSLEEPGYVANVTIYDDKGRLKRQLSYNDILATEGFLLWDGTLDDGSLATVGMYIIYYDFFHTNGRVISGKEVGVLALPLD